ncbi:MAG: molybdopterin dinucleotide binding domain-containing protein, partial [Myxococcota bacterium]
ANTIVRDPAWRTKDAGGSLRMHPDDAWRLSVSSGDTVRLTTRKAAVQVPVEVSDTMRPGHVSLPNGMGLMVADDAGRGGVAPNELTASEDRDPYLGTPWHKYVPARVEALA